MNSLTQLVVFRIDHQPYALALEVVERIVRAAEVTAVPNSPAIVFGVINIAGRVLPVLNVRRRFARSQREIWVGDHFLIAHTKRRSVILVIDEAQGVIEVPTEEIVTTADITPGLDELRGVAKLRDGVILIYDLDQFLSLDDERALDEMMNNGVPHGT